MQEDQTAQVLETLAAGYGLPTLSPVAVRLIELASDDACSVQDLTALIEKDPALTVRVLKLANSAFFRSLYPATTVRNAITRIGFHQLRVLALSLSLRDTFPLGKTGQMDYEQFWRTSLYQGLLAKTTAQQLRTCDPEEAFVAGLSLEIGFLIFFDLYLKQKKEITKVSFYPLELLLSWETEHFGINHRQVGEIALRYWKFPTGIVACQNSSLTEGETGRDGLPLVCNVAHQLSSLICQPDTDFQQVFLAVASGLCVGPEIISEAVVTTLKEVDDIAEALRVEVESEKDTLSLLEKAHATLGRLSEQILQQQNELPANLPSFESLRTCEDGNKTIAHTLEAVAHEIRNPLMAVGGFARRLAKTVDPSSSQWRYAEAILEEAMRLERSLAEIGRTLKQ